MAFLTVISLSSCLKDKFDIINADGSTPVVEFKNPGFISGETPEGATSYSVFAFAYENGTAVEKTYVVQLTGPDPAESDITLSIGANAAAVATLNAEKSVASTFVPFTVMPTALYTILTPTVVIPAGQRTAVVRVRYNTTIFNYAFRYALPLAITSGGGKNISKTFGTILLSVAAKNAYDGIYGSSSGAVQRYGSPGVPTVGDALNGSIANNPDLTLTTINATTTEIGNLRWAGGGSLVAGIDNLRATVDPVTNLVTMSSVGNATLRSTPGKTNTYDPATKTFTLNFDWGQTTAPREITNLVIKYKASR